MKSKKAIRKRVQEKKSWKLIVLEILSLLFGILGMFACIEITEMNNNLSGTKLFIIFALLGFALAYTTLKVLEKSSEELNIELNKRSSIIVGGILGGFILITPALANYYNRSETQKEKDCQYYTLTRKGIGGRSGSGWRDTYFLHYDINGEDEEIITNEKVYNYVSVGDKILLCIITGKLGFKYINSMYKIEQKQ
jgi:uncharacterized membrane protein